MLYPVQVATVLQYITEPCVQGLMATQVDADRQGSLQVSASKVAGSASDVDTPLLFISDLLLRGLRAATNVVRVKSRFRVSLNLKGRAAQNQSKDTLFCARGPSRSLSTPKTRFPAHASLAASLFFHRHGRSSLQGAVQSLRIIAAGLAGVGYGQMFSLGVSDGIDHAFGFLVPGLPFFCSAGFSLSGLLVSYLVRGLGVSCRQGRNAVNSGPPAAFCNFTTRCVMLAGYGLSRPLHMYIHLSRAFSIQMAQVAWLALRKLGEDDGGRGNAEPAGREEAFAEKVAATADGTALRMAVPWPNGFEGDEGPGLGASSEPRGDIRLTGLGDEGNKAAVSDIMSVPLLPRGGGGLNGGPQSLP